MFHSIKYKFKKKRYSFFSPLGLLISQKTTNPDNTAREFTKLPLKATHALELVDNPFLLKPYTYKWEIPVKPGILIRYYGLLLIWFYNNFYPGLWLLSHLRLNIYNDAEQAIDAFCKIHPKNQKVLCMPRSVFAATLSKRFQHHGVLFVGAFLPSRHLHAFIIEDNRNPCWFDHAWINYTPIAIMS